VRPLALLSLLVLLVAGCMGGDSAAIDRSELRGLVLQQEDLPASFIRFDEGRQGIADQPAGERADPTRFDRIEGWKARYRREGATAATKGPLVVESLADVFEGEGGARDELAAHRTELPEGWRALEDPVLGDEALAATLAQGAVSFYLVAWRTDNATASINVNGFEVTLEDALALARRQETRIQAAAEG
jgi:hypothetical protein